VKNTRIYQRSSLDWLLLLSLAGVLLFQGCTPRVELAGSDKPITINMNVKIDHEVRVKVDKELDQVISDDSGLF